MCWLVTRTYEVTIGEFGQLDKAFPDIRSAAFWKIFLLIKLPLIS